MPAPLPPRPAALDTLDRLIESAGHHLRVVPLGRAPAAGLSFELKAVVLGSDDPAHPALGVFGGVHGLERIGTEVALAFLAGVVARLQWDESLHEQLARLRLVVMPVVNPGGLWLGTRANPAGVDLMRNAPVEAQAPVPWLVGGQRLSAALPWYRGPAGGPLQPESAALCRLVAQELLPRPFSLVVDCHSGFGLRDRLWFPYAHTARPLPALAELHALARLFDDSLPNHPYVFEPQSRHYLAHGDLWDHLCLQAAADWPGHLFLPLTLEMGSWLWVKKNPRQVFQRHGIFNPLIAHRQQRVLRRHLPALDVLMRAALSHRRWCPAADVRAWHHEMALNRWYRIPRLR